MRFSSTLALAALPTLLVFFSGGALASPPLPVPTGGAANSASLVNVRVKSLVELRFENVVKQSQDLSCGAAALATLLKYYYGDDTTEEQIIKDMFFSGDREQIQRYGFSMLELKRYAVRQGYQAEGFRMTDAESLENLKIPVLAMISIRGYLHFVVVKGVDHEKVYLADPAFGNRSHDIDVFDSVWTNVILAVVSGERGGNNQFTLDPMLKAPMGGVQLWIDKGLRGFAPGPGDF